MPTSYKNCRQTVRCPKVGWWVGLGAVGQNKMCCNLCRLVRWVAALFILRRVGILSVVLLFVCCRLCHLLGLLVTRLYV